MRVVVIGGGISGLVAAHRLKAVGRGLDVQLLEAAPRAGGHAWTTREDGFVIEAGPNAVLERAGEPELRELARELGIESKLREARAAAKRRFILRRGRLHRAPDSPPTVLTTSLLSPLGKLRLMMEPWAAAPAEGAEETVQEFARRRIGREAAERLVDPAVAGISAGDSRRLSLRAAFPAMEEMEKSHGSLIRAMIARQRAAKAAGQAGGPKLVGFEGGMATLIDALVVRLGPALRTGRQVRRITAMGNRWSVECEGGIAIDADRVVLAVSAARAAALLKFTDGALAEQLAATPYAGLAVVALAYRAADIGRALDGYGYLVDAGEGLDTLGVVWESSLFEGRAPEGYVLVRVMMGGARHPAVAAQDEDALIRRARAELAGPMKTIAEPARAWVRSWPAAIAQYEVGHLERLAEARRLAARHPGLELCGSSYDGVSFTNAMRSGRCAAERVLTSLDRIPDTTLAEAL
jgi:oxygen-dependent protoporphyrinogen oxidase